MITNMTNDVDHSLALQALGWKTLKVERKKAKGKMICKLLNSMGPQSLTNLCNYKGDMTITITCETFRVRFVYHNCEYQLFKKSFMYDGPFLWNSIPKEIKESKSLSTFRKKIAAYIDSC